MRSPRLWKPAAQARLKVILEVSELETYDNIRAASFLAMRVIRPGDFIKTSTGKTSLNATLGNNQVMLEAIRDYYLDTGIAIAMKPAGGIRTAKQALQFLIAVKETLGDAWLNNTRYRFGASALLNDLMRQLEKAKTGAVSRRLTTSAKPPSPTDSAMPTLTAKKSPRPTKRAQGRPLPELIFGESLWEFGDPIARDRRPEAEAALRALHRRQVCRAGLRQVFRLHQSRQRAEARRDRVAAARPMSRPRMPPRRRRTTMSGARCPVARSARNISTASRGCCRTARANSPSPRRWTTASHQGIPRLRRADGGGAFLLSRRLGGQARVRGARSPRRAARRRRPGDPVEFPAADARVETRPGARDGQLRSCIKPAETTRSPR
jgi:hypothetical protein